MPATTPDGLCGSDRARVILLHAHPLTFGRDRVIYEIFNSLKRSLLEPTDLIRSIRSLSIIIVFGQLCRSQYFTIKSARIGRRFIFVLQKRVSIAVRDKFAEKLSVEKGRKNFRRHFIYRLFFETDFLPRRLFDKLQVISTQ